MNDRLEFSIKLPSCFADYDERKGRCVDCFVSELCKFVTEKCDARIESILEDIEHER